MKQPVPASPPPAVARPTWLLHRYALPAVIVVLVAAVALLALVTRATVERGTAAVNTVAKLDPKRYAGQWFEIARTPNEFQTQCVAEVTARYDLRPDGGVAVTNRCKRADGATDSANGVARRIDGDDSGARLEVSFLPRWMRWLPFGWGDYWVVELDAAYKVSVVSDRTGTNLWILAREPRLKASTYDALVKRLRARGFDVQRLVRTTQRGSDS